jgi:peroxiredoxin Q/BCP
MTNPHEPAAPSADEPARSIPQVGAQAPDIALPDETRTVHRLAGQEGRWTIVYFYPEDDTSGCTTEACQFRDLHEDIVAADADVWGVSPDGAASHERFKTKYGLPFTLLSDEDHAVAERYGAWGEKRNYGRTYMGIIRSSWLVGPDGRVAAAWPKVKADGHAAEVLAALKGAGAG